MMDHKDRHDIIMIEIDGLTWDILNPMLKNQQLPNLAKVIANGSSGILRSMSPPLSPMIWTSIVSGKGPHKHGVNNFSVTAHSVKCKRIWDIFTEKGLRCGTFSHLLTWPPLKLDCFCVPGMLAHGTETVPPELSFIKQLAMDEKIGKDRSLKKYFKHFFKGLRYGIKLSTFFSIVAYLVKSKMRRFSYKEAFFKKRGLAAQMNSDLFRRLYQKTRPDFSIFYTNFIDACCHQFWKYLESDKFEDVSPDEINQFKQIIPSAYRHMDGIVGELLNQTNENTTVIILSDHGFQAALGSENMPNCIIQSSKLLDFMGIKDQVVATNLALMAYLRVKDTHSEKQDQIMAMAKNIRVMEADALLFDVDTDDLGNIVLRVAEKPYIALSTSSLKGKTVSLNGSLLKYEELVREGDTKISGTHHLDGAFMIMGPNIRKGFQVSDAHVLDITPTLLALKGMPVAMDMDGKVLTTVINEQFIQQNPITYIETYESDLLDTDKENFVFEKDEKVMQQLKDLGYIE